MSTYRMAVVRSVAPVTDDDVLVYDDTDGTWVPSDAPAGGGTPATATDNGNGTSTIDVTDGTWVPSDTSATQVREAVASSTALPTTDNEAGDVRLAEDTDHLWLWDGTAWVDAGPAGVPGQDGQDGANGSDAQVTDANVAAAISDDTRAVIEGWGIIGGGGTGTGNTHTSADATRPALPAGTVWLSTAATRPATMQTGDIWIGEPL